MIFITDNVSSVRVLLLCQVVLWNTVSVNWSGYYYHGNPHAVPCMRLLCPSGGLRHKSLLYRWHFAFIMHFFKLY